MPNSKLLLFSKRIAEEILKKKKMTNDQLNTLKIDLCNEISLEKIPQNSQILSSLDEETRKKVLFVLQRKPIRTISGVAIVAVMTKPHECPHGKCIYCPGGADLGVPQSYTGFEPATMRGLMFDFDPYKQVWNRLSQLEIIGHSLDKAELIIMGGTFISTPIDYQDEFMHKCFEAFSSYPEEKTGFTKTLDDAQTLCESSKVRPVGITFETRPDYSKKEHIDQMLRLGGTRVELGVQTVSDDVYDFVDRGHSVKDVVDSTKLLKDSAYKVLYHLMPGLPTLSYEDDMKNVEKVFSNQEFRPDMLKLYPALVVKGTKLYDMYSSGEYKPYSNEEAVSLVADILEKVPKYMRVMRVQRDIPSTKIVAGVTASNLRELAHKELEKRGIKCNCIRCRELGHNVYKNKYKPDYENIEIDAVEYEASDGKEVFLSYEDKEKDVLYGFTRLRIPDKPYREEIDSKTALIRELHVYGSMTEISKESSEGKAQHRSLGANLLRHAEHLAMDKFKMNKMVIISGIGVRDYYRKFGYEKKGPYMFKELT